VLALTLALGSSLAWGVSDFMGGMAGRRLPLLMVLLVSQAVGLYLALVALAYFPEPFPDSRAALMATASGVADAVGLWALYRGLATSAMGIVAPVAATGAVLPVGYGLMTGQPGSAALIVGVGMAIAGVGLVALEPGGRRADEQTGAGAGVALGLLAALGFGLGFLLLGLASESGVGWSVLLNRVGSVGLVAVAVAVTWTPLRFSGHDFPSLAAIGMLDALAITLFAWASTRGSVGLVAALGSLYPVVTALLARALLNERLGMLRRIGAMAAVGGALMLSASAAEPVSEPEPAADVATSGEDGPAPRLLPIERLTRPAVYEVAPGAPSTGS
jgi:drug/metabolite transporter (DMT)-like permease